MKKRLLICVLCLLLMYSSSISAYAGEIGSQTKKQEWDVAGSLKADMDFNKVEEAVEPGIEDFESRKPGNEESTLEEAETEDGTEEAGTGGTEPEDAGTEEAEPEEEVSGADGIKPKNRQDAKVIQSNKTAEKDEEKTAATGIDKGKTGQAADAGQAEETDKAGAGSVYYAAFDGPNATKRSIQRALNKGRDGKYSAVNITLSGTILISGTLVVYSNTTINAENATIKEIKSCGSLLTSATAHSFKDGYQSGYEMTRNITINGGKWYGQKMAGQVIRFVHSSNVKLQNMTVNHSTVTGHMITLEGVKGALVENCNIYGYSGIREAKEAIHIDIVHNEATTPGLKPEEYDDLSCRNITIKNNYIHGVANGIGSHGAVDGVYHQNIVIEGNLLDGIQHVPVKIYNYKNTTIKANTIKNSKAGIKVYTYNIKSMDPNDSDNVKTYEAIPFNHKYNIIIAENNFLNITGNPALQMHGYVERPLGFVLVRKNIIKNVSSKGICLNSFCPNTKIEDNSISDTKESAVDIRGASDGTEVFQNRIYNSGGNGIFIYKTKSVVLSDNTVKKSKRNGIWVYNNSNNTSIKSNNVESAGLNGIYVSYSCNGTKVDSGNKISGNIKKNGIQIFQCTDSVVENNEVKKTCGNGIFIDQGSSSAIVKRNKVSNNGTQGITVYKATKVTLDSNTILKSGNIGIKVSDESDKSILKGNRIKGTKNTGIQVCKSADLIVIRNKITSPGNNGIYLSENSSGARIERNTVDKAVGSGIKVWISPNPNIKRNTIKNAGKEPILIGKTRGSNISTMSKAAITGAAKAAKINGFVNKCSKARIKAGGRYYRCTVTMGAFCSVKIPKLKVGKTVYLYEYGKYKNTIIYSFKIKKMRI